MLQSDIEVLSNRIHGIHEFIEHRLMFLDEPRTFDSSFNCAQLRKAFYLKRDDLFKLICAVLDILEKLLDARIVLELTHMSSQRFKESQIILNRDHFLLARAGSLRILRC